MASAGAAQGASFTLALEKFKAGLSEDEKNDFQFTTIEDLRAALKRIQDKHASERRQQWMGRLSRFLEAMGEYDKVIQVFVNPSQYLAFVWTASTFAEAFNNILDAYQQIGDSLPLLLQYQTYFERHPQMEQCDTLNRKVWTIALEDIGNFQADFGALLKQFQRNQRLIENQAGILHFEESLRTREIADRQLQEFRKAESRRQREVVRSWLASPNVEVDQQSYSSVRNKDPNSGRWILSTSKFLSWFDPDFCSTSLLWINGIPGAGKTVLASVIVEEARKMKDATVAFFYCKYMDLERCSFISVVRALLFQLLHQNATLLPYIYDAASHSGETILMKSSHAVELLDTALKSCNKVYIVLDGLDECERKQRKEISETFIRIVESLPPESSDTIRCLFISQDDDAARKDFATLPSLRIIADDNKADITAYVRRWCGELQVKFHLSIERTEGLAERITEESEGVYRRSIHHHYDANRNLGMFLFARLVLQNLLSQTTLADFEREVGPKLFPSGIERLSQAYDRILHTIFDNPSRRRNDHVLQLLSWLVCARRPPKWNEIQGAVSIDIENSCVDWERRRLREDSKELCGSLVEIRQDGTIELVHHTARLYLICNNRWINSAAEELRIAKLCIGYLSLPGFEADLESCTIRANLLHGYYAFLDYALVYWCRHLEKALAAIPTPTGSTVADLSEAIEVFLDLHWTEPNVEPTVYKGLRKSLRVLCDYSYFDRLVVAVAVAKKQLVTHERPSEAEQALDLVNIRAKVRDVLESMILNENLRAKEDHVNISRGTALKLQDIYGPNHFKCSRISCKFFYQGFDSKSKRDEHIAKHDRMFFCSFPGCPMSSLGCVSAADLQRHENEKHNVLLEDSEFPDPGLDKEKEVFTCSDCGKNFTRKHNWTLHKRIHKKGEKAQRLQCRYCPMTFARQGGRTRHESIEHTDPSNTPKFRCGGQLGDGTTWGCGKAFNRAENLARHYKGKRGSRCVPPTRNSDDQLPNEDDEEDEDEEAAETERSTAIPGTVTPI